MLKKRPERAANEGSTMSADFDPAQLPLYGLLVWPLAKSVVFVVASAVFVWSRKPARRAAARRLVRLISRAPADPAD